MNLGVDKQKLIDEINNLEDIVTLNSLVYTFTKVYKDNTESRIVSLSSDPYHPNNICSVCSHPVSGKYCSFCGREFK